MPGEATTYSTSDPNGENRLDQNLNTKIPLQEGEVTIAILNRENVGALAEEQFAAYRSLADSHIHLTFMRFDEYIRDYRRMWDYPTAATRAETISLFSQDLIGDRNNCIIVTGLNARNEQTMTIFRQSGARQSNYKKIAELQIAGSIVVQETVRSSAYQQGLTRGNSFNIITYGPDPRSSNMLDRIETVYSYNHAREHYEQVSVSRIAGSQIEQRRLRELLSGVPGVFENFIHGLWYYVNPNGTVDTKQYLYFNPSGKEIIFFGDEAQQVFRWQTSTHTRYGLFIRSQNISISTLSRSIYIELESLESIRLRVDEDVRLRITANTTWDGSYRRAAGTAVNNQITRIKEATNALYDSSWGRVQFNDNGEYIINSSDRTSRRGRYVFFNLDGTELLELRFEENDRRVYKVEPMANALLLSRVRLSTTGIQDMLEPPVTLTSVNQ